MRTLKVGDIAIAPSDGFIDRDYLTPNKEYKIIQVNANNNFYIIDDNGDKLFCLQKICSHINGDWLFKARNCDVGMFGI